MESSPALVRVLLLEDSEMDADLISAQLGKVGSPIEVVRAVDRAGFDQALELDGYDVILSDYSLPGFDGLSALEMARERTPQTPFIFVSGVLGEEIAAESLKQGATDYVLKSRLSRLQTAVQRALSESRARAERLRTEAALHEREASYRALVEAIGTVVWNTRADGQLDDAPRWRELTGQTVEEHRGWGWLDAVHPEDRAATKDAWCEALRKASVYDVEYRLRTADGTYRWYNARGVPVIDDGVIRQWVGVCIDIHDRKQADEHTRLLIHELNHRVKNNLATVQAIAAQTLRDAPSLHDARSDFMARLLALARAHDVLTRENWEGATLVEVIAGVVEPHCGAEGARFDLDGPPLRLGAKTALALSMALHELCTNAAKYGAFSAPEGKVSVGWRVGRTAGEPWLHLVWREQDGPPVLPPSRRGFGSKLIERGLASELRGRVKLNFEPGGVVCTLDAPLSAEPEI